MGRLDTIGVQVADHVAPNAQISAQGPQMGALISTRNCLHRPCPSPVSAWKPLHSHTSLRMHSRTRYLPSVVFPLFALFPLPIFNWTVGLHPSGETTKQRTGGNH